MVSIVLQAGEERETIWKFEPTEVNSALDQIGRYANKLMGPGQWEWRYDKDISPYDYAAAGDNFIIYAENV